MLEKFLSRGLAALAILSAVIFVIGCGTQTTTPSKQERQAEFERWFSGKQVTPQPKEAAVVAQSKSIPEEKSSEERIAEIQKILKAMIFDGKHEGPSLVLKLVGIDAFDFVVNTQPAREISAEITIKESLERVMEVLEVKRPEDLPPFVKVLPDGTVLFPGQLVGFDLPPTIGLLTKDYAITYGKTYRDFCSWIRIEKMENVLVQYSLRPASGEAAWQEEVLFDGTADKLCLATERYPKYYPENNALVLKRPAIKFFPVPDEPTIKLGSAADLKPGGFLVLPVLAKDGLKAIYGILVGVQTIPGSPIAVINFFGLPDGAIGPGDEGAPVYYISGDEESPLKLVGFITGGESTLTSAISAEYYLKGITEIPHVKK